MRIHKPRRLRQPAPIDQARVILGIAKDRIPFIDQRRHNARVRRKPRRKHERRLRAFELGQPPLQLRMRFTPPAHQRTRPAAPPFALTRDSRRFDQPLIRRQSEIIIRTKIDQLAAIEHDARRLRPAPHRKPPPQPRALQVAERVVDPCSAGRA